MTTPLWQQFIDKLEAHNVRFEQVKDASDRRDVVTAAGFTESFDVALIETEWCARLKRGSPTRTRSLPDEIESCVSAMTVQCCNEDSGMMFSGVFIDSQGTVLSTKRHVTLTKSDDVIDGEYTMFILDRSTQKPVSARYRLVWCCKDSDIAKFEPKTALEHETPYFASRKMPYHHDFIFCGEKIDQCAVFLSEGYLNYTTPRQAVVSARADHGRSGGPIFHLHDGEVTLVGLMWGAYGEANNCSEIVLLPDEMLTEGSRAESRLYTNMRHYRKEDIQPAPVKGTKASGSV